MKIRDGYILRTVAGKSIVVSIGAETNFSGMLTLNDTGAFFWELLKEDTTKEQMLEKILSEYDIDRDTVSKDIDNFIAQLQSAGILED